MLRDRWHERSLAFRPKDGSSRPTSFQEISDMANKHKSREQKAHDKVAKQAPVPGAGQRQSGFASNQQDILSSMQGRPRTGAKKRK
jgi:hypothetical protein